MDLKIKIMKVILLMIQKRTLKLKRNLKLLKVNNNQNKKDIRNINIIKLNLSNMIL